MNAVNPCFSIFQTFASRLSMRSIKQSDDVKGFEILPRRWAVERTFSWIGRNRRRLNDV